jgi:hypothetical protein
MSKLLVLLFLIGLAAAYLIPWLNGLAVSQLVTVDFQSIMIGFLLGLIVSAGLAALVAYGDSRSAGQQPGCHHARSQ